MPEDLGYRPSYLLYLKEADREGSVLVEVHKICVSLAFVGDDTLAAILIPGVFAAPLGDVNHIGIVPARTGSTGARGAVSSAAFCFDCCQNKEEK